MRRVLITIAGLLALGRVAAAEPPAPAALREIGVDERVGERVPLDLVFTDSTGERVTLGQLVDSRPVLLVLAYNRCAMLCSLVLRGLADGLRTSALDPGRDVRVIAVSIDPAETPDVAATHQAVVLEHVGRPGERARWPFLVGDEPTIQALATSLGFRYTWDERTRQYAHPAVVFVLTPEGVIARNLHGIFFGGPQLELAVRSAGAGELAPDADQGGGILSCFRLDALLRRYGPLIQRMFSLGALLILGAVTITLALLFRRERKARQ